MYLVRQDRFRFVHVLFVSTVEFLFLTKFSVGHLFKPLVSSLIFHYCYFWLFRGFHFSVSWWFLTGIWVTASFLRTLLSILADLNKAVVWKVTICPLISNTFSPFISPLQTVPSTLITISLSVIFMCHRFHFSGKGMVLNFLFAFFQFHLVVSREGKVHYSVGFLFFLTFFFLRGRGDYHKVRSTGWD